MKLKNIFIIISLLFTFKANSQNQNITLLSPNKSIEVKVSLRDKINYAVVYEGKYLTFSSPISLTLSGNQILGQYPELLTKNIKENNDVINHVFGNRSKIIDHYNELVLEFKGNYKVIFRAYDNAVAYRFVTNIKDEIKIINEEVDYRIKDYRKGWFSKGISYETVYEYTQIDKIPQDRRLFLPCLIECSNINMAITEADVIDYPSMQLQYYPALEGAFLKQNFEKYPTRTETGGFNDYVQAVKDLLIILL